jgi:hypothetical protein
MPAQTSTTFGACCLGSGRQAAKDRLGSSAPLRPPARSAPVPIADLPQVRHEAKTEAWRGGISRRVQAFGEKTAIEWNVEDLNHAVPVDR